MPRKKKKVNYVNNKRLLEELVKYIELKKECERNGEPEPRIPEYIGQCIMLISQRLSNKPNFMNYTYKDEMISDGYANCLEYMHNFNPEKSKNPFAYFTQIIYYAFLRRIEKEKKYLYTKFKAIDNNNLFELSHDQFDNEYREEIKQSEATKIYASEFVKEYERKKNAKK